MPDTADRMSDAASMRHPALIIVTGRPGAGKTTLAHALAKAVRCPAICRDEIKEGLVHTTGHDEPGADLQLRATDTFFDVVALFLDRHVTVVAEAAFQHKVWAPRLEALCARARVRLVLCEVDPARALARRVARDAARERFHPEGAGHDTPATYDPPRIDAPTLRVNTSDGYEPSFDSIVDFARS